jgi:c-di-GMP-binding flagellar brake protein YcgR
MSIEIAARLQFGDREVAFPAVRTSDISASGLGLIISDDRNGLFAMLDAWRDEVEVELNLPDGNSIKLPATIAWRRADQDDGCEQLLLGLKFGDVDAADSKALAHYIQ